LPPRAIRPPLGGYDVVLLDTGRITLDDEMMNEPPK
jgi:hypothetical protein